MNQDSRIVVIVLALAVVGGGGWFLWRRQQTPPAPPPVSEPMPQPVAATPPPPDVAPEPAIQNPIETATDPAPDRQGMPPLAEADSYVERALLDLLGRKAVASFLNVDGFVRRAVATVDNLPGERSQLQLWPVKETPGAFREATRPEGSVIAPENAARYAPLVKFVESVDTRRAARLYVRLYPLFQQAYEELGYPDKYFNDRLIQVIDHLLATPNVEQPIRIKRILVEGTARPGRLYQFEDPRLESRSAGQKILLRIGRSNADRLKAKLSEFRGQIARRRPQ